MMGKGFTLLELVVVIIVIGILASRGLVVYTRVMERARSAEVRANLGLLRKLEITTYLEKGIYTGDVVSEAGLPPGASGCSCSNTNYYFQYYCSPTGSENPGRCMAYRCAAGGKPPQDASPCNYFTLTPEGVWGEGHIVY